MVCLPWGCDASEASFFWIVSRIRPYEQYCLNKRINHIAQRIKEHQPKAVVFYGKLYEYYWRKITEQITDVEFTSTSEGFLISRNSQTVFAIAKHPVAFGATNEYFHSIGRAIATKI